MQPDRTPTPVLYIIRSVAGYIAGGSFLANALLNIVNSDVTSSERTLEMMLVTAVFLISFFAWIIGTVHLFLRERRARKNTAAREGTAARTR